MSNIERQSRLQNKLMQYQQRLDSDDEQSVLIEGRLTRMVGLTLEAVGFQVPIAAAVRLLAKDKSPSKQKWSDFQVKRPF